MLRQIGLALLSAWTGLKSLVRGSLLAPIAVYAIAQLVVLLLIVNFHMPVLSGMTAPFIRILGGGIAVHYPQLFVMLPAIFSKVNLVLGATLGAYVWGVAVVAVVNRLEGTSDSAWRVALARLPRLVITQLPILLAVIAMFVGSDLLLAGGGLSGNAKRLVLYGPVPVGILLESLFLFAPIAVMLEGRGGFSAIGRSLSVWRANAFAALLVVGLTTLPHIPTFLAMQRTVTLVNRFSPETVLFVLGGDVFLRVLTNVILIVAGTLLFLDVARREREA